MDIVTILEYWCVDIPETWLSVHRATKSAYNRACDLAQEAWEELEANEIDDDSDATLASEGWTLNLVGENSAEQAIVTIKHNADVIEMWTINRCELED